MHGAKEGGREGYRERVREREGNRERDGEWEKEKYTQFGKEASTDHPEICVVDGKFLSFK